MSNYTILPMDCRKAMDYCMAPQSVHTVVTSPPYFGLRDYGVDGQLGLEPTPDEFVEAMVEVFRSIRRVLRDDGTVWLNLGDSYAGSGKGAWANQDAPRKETYRTPVDAPQTKIPKTFDGIKAKELIGIPWRVALALQADGWYLRQDIIWHKPNPMPESVRDRCTKAHEYIFLLTKKPKYYFDSDAIKEPVVSTKGNARSFRGGGSYTGGNAFNNSSVKERETHGNEPNTDGKRNRRSVWTVTTKPFKGAHFATFPPDLIEPCVLAGAPEYCCEKCGAPIERVIEKTDQPDPSYNGSNFHSGKTGSTERGARPQEGDRYLKQQTGWKYTCKCGVGYTSGTVFDPFGGSGTTALVALKHGRNAILSELNPEYVEMAHKRIGAGK